jgi:hypothetical protein
MQEILKDYLIDDIKDENLKGKVKKIEKLKLNVQKNIKILKKTKKNLMKKKKENICKIYKDHLKISPNEDSFLEDDLFFFKNISEDENKNEIKSKRLIKLEERIQYKLKKKKIIKPKKKKETKKKNKRNPFLISTDDYLDIK